MGYEFDWIDAFTETAFGGNACVVVHGAATLSVPDRMALVRETSLSECAFLVPSDVADFGARYYLAEREIPMAGHPTIATVWSLVHRGLVTAPATLTLELGAGVFEIAVTQDDRGLSVIMSQGRPEFGATSTPKEIAEIFHLDPDDIVGSPQISSTGNPFCVTLLRDLDALGRAVLNPDALAAWQSRQSIKNASMMEPFLSVVDGQTSQSRLFLPPPMPAEDPFTGSATGSLVAYLWHHGVIEHPQIMARQGDFIGRPGVAQARALGGREAPTGVEVSGRGALVMSGVLHL
ncbi:MAG: PhzF family phenazine biosynthesis protein [Pseudomonadota bacterium]